MHEEIKYPFAIKKRVAGDWNCSKCGNLNFSFRVICNKCESPKPLSNPFGCALYVFPPTCSEDTQDSDWPNQTDTEVPEIPSITPFLEEDFDIPLKSPENRKKSKSENTEPSSDHEKNTQIFKRVKKPSTKKAGDWVCLKCLNLNFSFRNNCNICKRSKSDFIEV